MDEVESSFPSMAISSVLALSWCLVVAQLPTQQRVTVSSEATPEVAKPGDSVTLTVKVTPKKDIRIFGLGSKDFTPVTLLLNIPRGVSTGLPGYPIPERQSVPGAKDRVPVYDDRIELTQKIKLSKKSKPGDTVKIDGFLTYQVCDDTVTYRRTTVPVSFTVNIQ
jgi:DsbC/DsbD-like thiol-disulfide interchange protein